MIATLVAAHATPVHALTIKCVGQEYCRRAQSACGHYMVDNRVQNSPDITSNYPMLAILFPDPHGWSSLNSSKS